MERDSWVRDPLVRALLLLLVALAAFQLASVGWSLAAQFGDIILIFFLSWLLAFTLTPLVTLLMLCVGVRRLPMGSALLVYCGGGDSRWQPRRSG